MHAISLQVACLLLAQTTPTSDPFSPSLPPIETPSSVSPLQFEPPKIGVPTPAKAPSLAPVTPQVAPPTPLALPLRIDDETPATVQQPKQLDFSPPATRVIESQPDLMRASAQEPLGSLTDKSNARSAQTLLMRALEGRQQNSIAGKPITLLEALNKVNQRSQQISAIKAYWQVSIGQADFHHAWDEAILLANLPMPLSELGRLQLRAAQTTAQSRLDEAILAVVAAQHDLAAAADWSDSETLPLPANISVVGRYRSRFDELFANRAAPAGLRKLDALFPLYVSLIDSRANSVGASQKTLAMLVSGYQAGELGIDTLIKSFVSLRDQRIKFLAAIRDYNNSIAEYSLNVVGPNVSREDIVSMLVLTKSTGKSILVPSSQSSKSRGANGTQTPTAPLTADRRNGLDPPPARVVPVKPAPSFVPSTGNSFQLP